MTDNPQDRQMRVDREKVLFAYTDALERGDFEDGNAVVDRRRGRPGDGSAYGGNRCGVC